MILKLGARAKAGPKTIVPLRNGHCGASGRPANSAGTPGRPGRRATFKKTDSGGRSSTPTYSPGSSLSAISYRPIFGKATLQS